MNRLQIRKLSAGSVYKLTFVGLFCAFGPLFLFFGVMAAFGFHTMTWNGEAVTGIGAVLLGPLMGLLVALVLTGAVGSVMAAGLWVFSKVRPITLEFTPVEEVATVWIEPRDEEEAR